jgi:NADPH:quinone reductase-like Zn-dependent oxidoreductase
MKAIVQDSYGQADVLGLRDVESPAPGDDQVLIHVRAAGIDAGVWHLVTGTPYLIRAVGYGLRKPKHPIPGSEVAGDVEAVGKNVTDLRPGDEVFGICEGAFAEAACARRRDLAVKPSNLTFEQAAAVPVSASTALQALRDRGRVQPGQKVLVVGAAGGVGTFAVQLAKTFGAEVTGVCSTSKTDLVRSIGADDVLDYTREDFTDGTRQYDLIIDCAGNRPLSRVRRALTARGTLVVVGGEDGGRWLGGALLRTLRASLLSPFVGQRLCGLLAKVNTADLDSLRDLIEAGKVTPVVDRTFALAEVPDALRHMQASHARGKVVVRV